MCYYFWGLADNAPMRDWLVFTPDWAWAEWVEQQGIGE